MKIAYVLNTYPLPSHSFIRREVRALERGGSQVLRLAMRRSALPLVDAQDREEEAQTQYVLERGAGRLLLALAGRALRHPGRTWAALRQAIRAGRASQVGVLRHLIYLAEAAEVANRCAAEGVAHMHAHFGTNATTVAMLAHALGGPGYSFTTHGPEEFDAPAALSLGDKLDRSAFAVAISQFGRSQLCRWAAFETWERIKVVHCGIEPGAFADPTPLPGGPLRLVNIGRFSEQKGQVLLIEAMAALHAAHPGLHLTLVGDGELRGALERAIAAHGLDDAVTLTGWLDEAGVRRELAAAHALILPSFAEGLPMVVMEAMAAARPVIATYIAGIPELVRPGETGWLVPAGDAQALTDSVAEMAATPPAALTAMGQAGRARVLARHDAETEAARLAAHIAAVCAVTETP
ncbi:glycosyltransferase [Antarcticimicrobium luteum]|uniref:Colanic acid biosynthesis glycosyltransferase WcaL n=1 Tax=Antarcticimicrobium luteum TaxID=2547397 RepID=A0A4R5USR6_9RHOB|nr:glycosyltransferase [Antarcticimicrobium luteum]TDK42133.1 colanic acid biosynthesis glycosyltransferase WcaL [Antarcticimicrobium luteum]